MKPISVLVVESLPGVTQTVQLCQAFSFVSVNTKTEAWLSNAIARLDMESFDIILLSLELQDSTGLDTFVSVQRAAPNTPVLIVSNNVKDELAINSVRYGAQSFIVKSQTTPKKLQREVLFAIERCKNDITAKRLYMSARTNIADVSAKGTIPPPPIESQVVEPHVNEIEDFIVSVINYVGANSTDRVIEHVADLMKKSNIKIIFKELRSLLSLDKDVERMRTKTVSIVQEAERHANSVSEVRPIQSTQDAEQALIDALRDDT